MERLNINEPLERAAAKVAQRLFDLMGVFVANPAL